MEFKILVNSFEKVQKFVSITNESDYDIDLLAGRNTYLDAKSLMGILSCNISEPMVIKVNCHDASENAKLKSQLSDYIVSA